MMHLETLDNRWSHTLFLAATGLAVWAAMLDYNFSTELGQFLTLITLALIYSLAGTVGWHYLSKNMSILPLSVYLLVQVSIVTVYHSWDVNHFQDSVIPLIHMPLFFQLAALSGVMRWGIWTILALSSAWINLWYEFIPGDITMAVMFMGVFALAGHLIVKETTTRIHVQQLMAELKQQYQEDHDHYEYLNEMREEFVNSATHDLKNPLNVFSGYVSILEDHPKYVDDELLQRYVKQMQSSTEKMQHLITGMLDLAKASTKSVHKFERVYLNPIVEESVSGFTNQAEEKHIKLTFEPSTDNPCIETDSKMIARAVDNLISNAIKYTKQGEVDVKVMVDDKRVSIAVKDTGMGIPEDALPKLYETFYRVEHKSHYDIEGTGLGLAIVKAIADQHNGTVNVQSEMGKGSTFTFTMPMESERKRRTDAFRVVEK